MDLDRVPPKHVHYWPTQAARSTTAILGLPALIRMGLQALARFFRRIPFRRWGYKLWLDLEAKKWSKFHEFALPSLRVESVRAAWVGQYCTTLLPVRPQRVGGGCSILRNIPVGEGQIVPQTGNHANMTGSPHCLLLVSTLNLSPTQTRHF